MTLSTSRAARLLSELAAARPRHADELHRLVRHAFGLNVPRRAVIEGHSAPFDYLCAAFFDEAKPEVPGDQRDLIVWANRGGGKTMLGAVATMLDLLFKPGIRICILGGSMEQSSRMYEYLCELANRPWARRLLVKAPTQRELRLINGSLARALTQSPRSVRGQHVHKLRCDEVDEFKDKIWDAAQFVPRSGRCGDRMVRGSIEALSTMHKAYGPMSKVIEKAQGRVLRWCALDVIERCPPARDCATCVLHADCGGRAKEADGFVPVDDVIAAWHRSSNGAWAAEMMCRRPSTDHSVYPQFDSTLGGKHVMLLGPIDGQREQVAATRALHQELPCEPQVNAPQRVLRCGEAAPTELVGGMDFGIRNPFVMLWARVAPATGCATVEASDPSQCIVEVVEEFVQEGLTLEQNVKLMEERGWPRPAWIGADPAGGQRSSQTGISDIGFLRRRGYKVRAARTMIHVGIEIIRRRLDRGTLRIDPSCTKLIQSLATYHFDERNPNDATPVKDGADHACDALRYLLVNLEVGGGKVQTRGW